MRDDQQGVSRPDEACEKLSVSVAYVPRKAADILELDMSDGVIIYSRVSDLVHHLNFWAGLVWQLSPEKQRSKSLPATSRTHTTSTSTESNA